MLVPWIRRALLGDPKKLGRWGQKQAEQYLRRKGHRILARNFAYSGGEIDLIAADSNGTVTFVEVKTRRNEDLFTAKAAVNAEKKKKIIRTAKCFLARYKKNLAKSALRFDIITVVLGSENNPEITHYPNSFHGRL